MTRKMRRNWLNWLKKMSGKQYRKSSESVIIFTMDDTDDLSLEERKALGRQLQKLISRGAQLLPQKELDRRYQAALRCRERLISIPFYAERDKRWGMEFWLNYQGSAALADQ